MNGWTDHSNHVQVTSDSSKVGWTAALDVSSHDENDKRSSFIGMEGKYACSTWQHTTGKETLRVMTGKEYEV